MKRISASVEVERPTKRDRPEQATASAPSRCARTARGESCAFPKTLVFGLRNRTCDYEQTFGPTGPPPEPKAHETQHEERAAEKLMVVILEPACSMC